jgi:hypothetical protein
MSQDFWNGAGCATAVFTALLAATHAEWVAVAVAVLCAAYWFYRAEA